MHMANPATKPAQRLDDSTREASAGIVLRAIGLNPISLEPIVGRGMSAQVIVANTSDGRFVVRLQDSKWLANFQKEAWCLEQAHENGIPVPRVIEVGIEGTQAFSLARFVEDTSPIHSGFNRLRVWEKLGAYAKKLNDVQVVGFGPEMTAPGRFARATWQDMLSPEIQFVFRDDLWERRGILSKQQSSVLRRSFESCYLLEGKPGICQWDMCCENALIRNGSPDDVILLDLDQAVSVLTPHYQLAYVAKPWGLESEIMGSFLRGYGMTRDEYAEILPEVRQLVALQSMRSVRWAEDRNPAWLERNIEKSKADLAGVVAPLT